MSQTSKIEYGAEIKSEACRAYKGDDCYKEESV